MGRTSCIPRRRSVRALWRSANSRQARCCANARVGPMPRRSAYAPATRSGRSSAGIRGCVAPAWRTIRSVPPPGVSGRTSDRILRLNQLGIGEILSHHRQDRLIRLVGGGFRTFLLVENVTKSAHGRESLPSAAGDGRHPYDNRISPAFSRCIVLLPNWCIFCTDSGMGAP